MAFVLAGGLLLFLNVKEFALPAFLDFRDRLLPVHAGPGDGPDRAESRRRSRRGRRTNAGWPDGSRHGCNGTCRLRRAHRASLRLAGPGRRWSCARWRRAAAAAAVPPSTHRSTEHRKASRVWERASEGAGGRIWRSELTEAEEPSALEHVMDARHEWELFHAFEPANCTCRSSSAGAVPPGAMSRITLSKFMILELIAAVWSRSSSSPSPAACRTGQPPKGGFLNAFEVLLTFIRDEIAKPTIGDTTPTSTCRSCGRCSCSSCSATCSA